MSWWTDFKSFAFKGNVIDLAVGVVIGGAFGKIVSGLVDYIVMPFVSIVLPSGDWRSAGWVLRAAPDPKDAVVLKSGAFFGAVLDFVIVAFVMFLLVSKFMKKVEEFAGKKKMDDTKACPFCLEKIPLKATRCKACTSQLEKVPESKPAFSSGDLP